MCFPVALGRSLHRVTGMHFLLSRFFCVLLAGVAVSALSADSIRELFESRARSIVGVEYFIQRELDRQPRLAYGLVLDEAGTIILDGNEVPENEPVERLKDFRVFPLGEDTDGFSATYLGQDHLTSNHYLRLTKSIEEIGLTPITAWEQRDPKMGDVLWGIAANDRDWDFIPYRLQASVSEVIPLPLMTGFTNTPVGRQGSAAFHADGAFAGWIQPPLGEARILNLPDRRLSVQVVNPAESTTLQPASVFFAHAGRIPENPSGDPQPWIGIVGMQALDRETADFLDLRGQGATIISDIVEGSPADLAGMESRDIIVSIEGEPLPRFVPRNVVIKWLVYEINQRAVGDTVRFGVIRGTESLEIELTLADTPMSRREAPFAFYEDIGLTVRRFLVGDGISRRLLQAEVDGAVVSFVDRNGPAHSAGIREGDWIKEIDGTDIAVYAEATQALDAIVADDEREEAVILIERNNETQLMRVQLPD